jgi:hypothetical protein
MSCFGASPRSSDTVALWDQLRALVNTVWTFRFHTKRAVSWVPFWTLQLLSKDTAAWSQCVWPVQEEFNISNSMRVLIVCLLCTLCMGGGGAGRGILKWFQLICFSSVGIALGYGLDDRGSRVRFPAGTGNFSLHHRVQNGSGAHPASYPMGTRGCFPEGEADHSPPSSAEVKEWVELYLHSPIRLHGVVFS